MVLPLIIGFVLLVNFFNDHIILWGFLRIIKQLVFIGILSSFNLANLSHLLRCDQLLLRLIIHSGIAIRWSDFIVLIDWLLHIVLVPSIHSRFIFFFTILLQNTNLNLSRLLSLENIWSTLIHLRTPTTITNCVLTIKLHRFMIILPICTMTLFFCIPVLNSRGFLGLADFFLQNITRL